MEIFQGNSCNIGIIARDPAFLPYTRFNEKTTYKESLCNEQFREQLTEEVVAKYFAHVFEVKYF